MNKLTYSKIVDKMSPPSPKAKDFVMAFLVGGLICVIGQLLRELFLYFSFDEETTGMCVSITLIFAAALLTGLGLFEKIAKRAGAGTLVPITGFANAVVAPAIEFKPEGQVLGIGVKMFSLAGPVILFGSLAAAIYGCVIWLINVLG
jgi:stage V sporulation protein AC